MSRPFLVPMLLLVLATCPAAAAPDPAGEPPERTAPPLED